jgi:hypothetical protein
LSSGGRLHPQLAVRDTADASVLEATPPGGPSLDVALRELSSATAVPHAFLWDGLDISLTDDASRIAELPTTNLQALIWRAADHGDAASAARLSRALKVVLANDRVVEQKKGEGRDCRVTLASGILATFVDDGIDGPGQIRDNVLIHGVDELCGIHAQAVTVERTVGGKHGVLSYMPPNAKSFDGANLDEQFARLTFLYYLVQANCSGPSNYVFDKTDGHIVTFGHPTAFGRASFRKPVSLPSLGPKRIPTLASLVARLEETSDAALGEAVAPCLPPPLVQELLARKAHLLGLKRRLKNGAQPSSEPAPATKTEEPDTVAVPKRSDYANDPDAQRIRAEVFEHLKQRDERKLDRLKPRWHSIEQRVEALAVDIMRANEKGTNEVLSRAVVELAKDEIDASRTMSAGSTGISGSREANLERWRQGKTLVEGWLRRKTPLSLEGIALLNATVSMAPLTFEIETGTYRRQGNDSDIGGDKTARFILGEDVLPAMHDLMRWYEDHVRANDLHPIELAAQFYQRFISIHPFANGNGRTSRLLLNYVLQSHGLPPATLTAAEAEVAVIAGHAKNPSVAEVVARITRGIERTLAAFDAP